MEIKKIGIIGQGALGVMYGNYLKKRMGNENVFFIADESVSYTNLTLPTNVDV